jgi:hypothetical protein
MLSTVTDHSLLFQGIQSLLKCFQISTFLYTFIAIVNSYSKQFFIFFSIAQHDEVTVCF